MSLRETLGRWFPPPRDASRTFVERLDVIIARTDAQGSTADVRELAAVVREMAIDLRLWLGNGQ